VDRISPADFDAKKQKTKSTTKRNAFAFMMQAARKTKSTTNMDAVDVMMQSAKTTLDFDLLTAEGHVYDWDAPVSQEEVDQASHHTKAAACRLNDRFSGYFGSIDPFLQYCQVWMNEDSDQMSEFNRYPEIQQNPMPPPITEPNAKAYLKEIRVHFASKKADDTTKFVHGFTLRYSDGVQKVVGNIRGTTSPGSIELDPDEHLVGINQSLDRKGGRTVAFEFYISNPTVDVYRIEVSSDDMEREYQIWFNGSEFQSKTGHVIKSLEFSETEQKLTGIQAQKKPLTKNEPYEGPGHGCPDSETCEHGDPPFSDLEKCRPKKGPRNIAQYLYLVPLKARPALKKLQHEFREEGWDLLFRKVSTYDWFEQNYRGPCQEIRDQAGKLLVVTPEARNIKKLESVITKIENEEARHFTEEDKSRVTALIRNEDRILNETRIPLISTEGRMLVEAMEATLIQDFRDCLKHKWAMKKALVGSFLSRLRQFSTKQSAGCKFATSPTAGTFSIRLWFQSGNVAASTDARINFKHAATARGCIPATVMTITAMNTTRNMFRTVEATHIISQTLLWTRQWRKGNVKVCGL
jgi:hypothetical protein